MKITLTFSRLVVLSILQVGGCIALAQQPLLTITSPADGTVVKPGDTITITVSADPSVLEVGVSGSGPLSDTQATTTPNQFQLAIPTELSLRKYSIRASGAVSGQLVQSASVQVDVERPDAPKTLTFPTSIPFEKVGDQSPININGTFSDGLTLNMTESSHVSYTSRDTTVATVNSTGMVTAVGSGNTFIIIKAGSGSGATGSGPEVAVQIKVPHKLAFSGLGDSTAEATSSLGAPVTFSVEGIDAAEVCCADGVVYGGGNI